MLATIHGDLKPDSKNKIAQLSPNQKAYSPVSGKTTYNFTPLRDIGCIINGYVVGICNERLMRHNRWHYIQNDNT